MAAVARATGAPSGSVYHRFPHRAVLLGELWLRTVERFHEGFLAALTGDDPYQAACHAARHVVDWSRDHPEEARVLLHGSAEFAEADWPPALAQRAAAANRRLREALRGLAVRLGSTGPPDAERLAIAVVDLPYAVVRRHLSGGTPIPGYAGDLVADAAAALLGVR